MKIKSIVAVMIMSLISCILYGQTVVHPWWVTDGGGGTSTGGAYTLSSSVGQPSIGLSGGGSFTLEAGFLPGVRQLSGTTSSLSLSLINGWNMLAVPFKTPDMLKTTLYPGATSFAYAFVGGSYQREDTLKNGVAYWLKFPPAQTATSTGAAFAPETLVVVPGWNMIGSISYPALTSSIVATGTLIKSFFYGYGSLSYYQEDTLKAGLGYWIKVSALGSLIIGPAPAITPTSTTSIDIIAQHHDSKRPLLTDVVKGEGFQQVKVKDARSQERSVYFAGSSEEVDVTFFELPPSPPDDILDVRFASQRMAEMIDAKNGKMQEFPIRITGAQFPVTISWNADAASICMLEVQMTGLKVKEYPLNKSGSLVVNEDQLKSLTIRVTQETVIDLPKDFSLYQNYPNPFNPTTKIQYDLPRNSRVSLKVYNLIGQEVAEVVQEEKAAGRYVAEFNANNFPSGVYYYRLEAHPKEGGSDFTMVRKLLLMK